MPPAFAPVYRPRPHNQTFLLRQQKVHSRKRKRGSDTDSVDHDDHHPSRSSASPPPTRSPHPVTRTDPYHIAGLSRDESPPAPPFPHAAVKERHVSKQPIDEALAALNPPLYVEAPPSDDNCVSLKRRHLDNLTFLLHRSLLRADWSRAARIWSILLRVEVDSSGIDIRRHQRWGIGAEVLMRQPATQSTLNSDLDVSSASPFSDAGFLNARQYYERLVLQYPHTASTQHNLNATSFYPALFNIWVYEVQDRSKRASEQVEGDGSGSVSPSNRQSSDHQRDAQVRKIRATELDEALPIAKRMDDLLLSPPYDTHTTLLHLRAMIALWIADLQNDMIVDDGDISTTSESTTVPITRSADHHRANALASRQKAEDILTRLADAGHDVPNPFANLKRATRPLFSSYPDGNYS